METFIKLFKQYTDSAGWFYSNQVRRDVKLFGAFSGTYSAGSKSTDGKRHFIFLNDEDAQASGETLPQLCYLNPESGEVLTQEEYSQRVASTPVSESANTSVNA